MDGQTNFCATSLEFLFDFARYLFGSNMQFKTLTTTYLTNLIMVLHNQRIEGDFSSRCVRISPMSYPCVDFLDSL
ncbi:hypothetical protein Ahy_B03g064768 [Arachis hypogaea]|uniref:BURP domain-containing protein n=1 Tax=Arachis hypogaea TaxID=3818 RepID=A0A445A0C3_ARAHY|nr:hypothetical protein Ahy_B03g064768 [Arachis hypogaea]